MKTVMKKLVFLTMGLLLVAPSAALADEPTTQELLQEIKALQQRVLDLESRLQKTDGTAKKAHETSTRSIKLSEQLAKAAEETGTGLVSAAEKRVNIYGAVEFEAAFERVSFDNGDDDESSSDFGLATAELFIEADINDYTKGVIHFLWEDGDDAIGLDEGFILLGQTDDMPWYAMGGLIYPAVGLFESNFVSDPITLELFETQETALEVGYANEIINIGVGTYNSDVHEAGDDPDSMINTFYGRVQVTAPEGLMPGLEMTAGVAVINNIAGSDFLREQVVDQQLSDLVAGWSAMATIQFDMVGVTAEYVGALDDFKAGELEYAGEADDVRPWAFNLELFVTPLDEWTFAAKYEKAGDVFEELPESRYGVAASWEFMPSTAITVEYMHGEFENDDTSNSVTAQLAVAF
jgi:hypothetical protein